MAGRTSHTAEVSPSIPTLDTDMAPLAVGAAKKIIKRGEGVDLMTQQDMEANHNSMLLRTDDFQEGITAMMEKRPAKWKGE